MKEVTLFATSANYQLKGLRESAEKIQNTNKMIREQQPTVDRPTVERPTVGMPTVGSH